MGKNRTFNLKALKEADPLNCKRLLNSYSFMSMLNPWKAETVLKICLPVTEEPDNFLAQGCILFIQEIYELKKFADFETYLTFTDHNTCHHFFMAGA